MKRLAVLLISACACVSTLAIAGPNDELAPENQLAYLTLMDESLKTIELAFQSYLITTQSFVDDETKSRPGVKDDVSEIFTVSMATLAGVEMELNMVKPPSQGYLVIHNGAIKFCSEGRRALASEHTLFLKGKFSLDRTAKEWENVFSGISTIRKKISGLKEIFEKDLKKSKELKKSLST